MYHVHFHNPIPVHFIGIGGISMSGLAEILLKEGFPVSGSDSHASALTEHLERAGARICIGQAASNIPEDCKLVVYTAAIHPDNPEYREAKRRGVPMLSRAELLGQLMRNYQTSIAVAGTHGKTTTTSMIASILLEEDADPTISVGGILPSIGGNIRVGGSEVFLTEACEYTNSFLHFFPTIGIILNIEEDHMDFFKDLNDIRRSFRRFAELLPVEGLLIINSDIPDYEEITEGLTCRVVTFGSSPDADYRAENTAYDTFGHPSFDLIRKIEKDGRRPRFSLKVPGEHNVCNALASIALADALRIPEAAVEKGLLSFTGTDRRFQYKGEVNGVTIIDDYAHHPTEIRATLHAAAHYPHRELWCLPEGIRGGSVPGRSCGAGRYLRGPGDGHPGNQLQGSGAGAGGAGRGRVLFPHLRGNRKIFIRKMYARRHVYNYGRRRRDKYRRGPAEIKVIHIIHMLMHLFGGNSMWIFLWTTC